MPLVCNTLQRYKFESNSQPIGLAGCPLREVCNTLQRYKFESNSQRLHGPREPAAGCVIPCKDTNLKAIHNDHGLQHTHNRKEEGEITHLGCVIPCKDTNLKAIHNMKDMRYFAIGGV